MSDDVVVKSTPTRRKKGGAKKHGRARAKCNRYRMAGIREKNKAQRIAKDKRLKEKARLKKQRRRERIEAHV